MERNTNVSQPKCGKCGQYHEEKSEDDYSTEESYELDDDDYDLEEKRWQSNPFLMKMANMSLLEDKIMTQKKQLEQVQPESGKTLPYV
jgi:hypothetical protein